MNNSFKEIWRNLVMKTWENAEMVELNISETAHGWTGWFRDGGYIGDGVISGHLQWDEPENRKS